MFRFVSNIKYKIKWYYFLFIKLVKFIYIFIFNDNIYIWKDIVILIFLYFDYGRVIGYYYFWKVIYWDVLSYYSNF